jgi:hypothetical protein
VQLIADGETAEITLPLLTMNLNSAVNSVSGLSVPGTPATLSLHQAIGCDGACTRSIPLAFIADAQGNYQVSYSGWRWWDCSPAAVGAVCSFTVLETSVVSEHRLRLFSPLPSPVPADAYEEDNSSTDAYVYDGISHHSFHVDSDVDWIRFTVDADDIGQAVFLDTFHLGLMEDTRMILYDTNATTILALNDDGPNGLASQIVFIPHHRGGYYLKIFPYDAENNTGNCGSTYSFIITRHRLFLPLLVR